MPDRPATVAKVIRERWRRELEQADEIDVPKVAESITTALLHDPKFLISFAQEYLADEVVDVGHRVLRATRERQRVGTTYSSPEQIRASVRAEIEEERASRVPSRFARWMELDPADGRLVALPTMTRDQVLAAAGIHQEQGRIKIVRSQWLFAIADRMHGDQTVAEVWRDDELTALANQINDCISPVQIGTSMPAIPVLIHQEES